MPAKNKAVAILEPVEPLVREIRSERVILDSDLARIYGVETKALNRAVKRNRERFRLGGIRNFVFGSGSCFTVAPSPRAWRQTARQCPGGLFHCATILRHAKEVRWPAAAAFGKWPRFLSPCRTCRFRLSSALVVSFIFRTSGG